MISIQHLLIEMCKLEVSLAHLKALEFGECIDCGTEIGFDRLIDYPAAQRCMQCQDQYEKVYLHESTYSINIKMLCS